MNMRYRGVLILAAAAATTVTAISPATASSPTRSPAPRHYVFVRVDTGQPGGIATDAEAVAAASGATRYWAAIPGAPHVTITVVHALMHGHDTDPWCGMTVGRDALAAAGNPVPITDGVVTFLRLGYPCYHSTAHGDMPGVDVEAFGGGVTWRDIAHELGHNLGLCAGTIHDRQAPSRWTPAAFTGPTSYGNPYSVMGAGEGPPSAPCQASAGWLTPTPWPAATARVRDLTLPGPDRGWQFRYGGHVYTAEYRPKPLPAPTLGPTVGVVLYRDGAVIEYAADTYALRPAHTYRIGGRQGVRVTAVGRTYALIQRVTIP